MEAVISLKKTFRRSLKLSFGFVVVAGLFGCSDTEIQTSESPTPDVTIAERTSPKSELTFAEIVGINLQDLPEQMTEGEDFITRIDYRVPHKNTRYDYLGSHPNSAFCRAFYAAFEQDKRDFIRIVQTSGSFAKYSFDGRFRTYLEPTDIKDILSRIDFPSIPWKDVPTGAAAARQVYAMHYTDFSYTPEGRKQVGRFPHKKLDEFLKSIPSDYKPFQLYQTYSVPESKYVLFRTEGTDLFDPNLSEELKIPAKFPNAFRTYRHHKYSIQGLYAADQDHGARYGPISDFITQDGLHFVGLNSVGNFRESHLGTIGVGKLDPKLPPGPSKGPDCAIAIYLTPKAKLHLDE